MKFRSVFDPFLVIPLIGLSGISLFILGSTTPKQLTVQLFYYGLGALGFGISYLLNGLFFKRFSLLISIFGIILLIAVLFAAPIRGSHRWINLGFFLLQPSEILKPVFIISLATILSHASDIKPKYIFLCLLYCAPWIALIFRQPDLGNTLVYITVLISMLFVWGIRLIYIVLGGIFTLILAPLGWLLLREYQRVRLMTFLNPSTDPSGAGYNAIQAMITIGSGQLLGLGLGKGSQSRLLFLPEYHTDFVFASLGEEMGFLGGAIVIFMYAILLYRILIIAREAATPFEKYLTVGVFSQLFIHIIINIGMNMGVVPITGITLPLISYGGSSIISTLAALGLVASVSSRISPRPLVIR